VSERRLTLRGHEHKQGLSPERETGKREHRQINIAQPKKQKMRPEL
jgi:hypothetical protein